MWTVLIFLNLGAVHCTVSSSLPSPINVTFSSVNLWNKLQWFPGRDTPEDANFKVVYAIYGDSDPTGKKVNWRAVERCTGIARNWCDLTNETRDLEQEYYARVRAVSRTQISSWTMTRKRFHPKVDTSFGPPLMSVEVGDRNAIITLKGPMRHQPNNHTPAVSMAALYPQMSYTLSVKNTRRGTTLHVPMNSDSYKYQLMEYDTEYCFSAATKFLSMPAQCLSSAPHCITTPQDPVIGQLLSVVVSIVVPSVCMCMVVVVGYLLHNYLTGKGQKSPDILNQPALPGPDLSFPNTIVIAVIKDNRPERDKSDGGCSGCPPYAPPYAPHCSPGYACQGGETAPHPPGDWSVQYGCVVAAPVRREDGDDPEGGDGIETKEWNAEELHSAGRTRTEVLPTRARAPPPCVPGEPARGTPQTGRHRFRLNPPTDEGMAGGGEGGEDEEVPLLPTGSTEAASSVTDRSDLITEDYGVVRSASENYEEEEEEEERVEQEQEHNCINWNPETGRLVLPQMGGLMQEEDEDEEEEEEEEVELRLENVFVRQGSEEKMEAQREMEGGGGTRWEVEDFSKRWNLVVSLGQ